MSSSEVYTSETTRVGQRILLHGQRGTIRYIGQVHGTQGTWLGVEWDDPSRGKHSGEKDGRKYFDCSLPGSGSFVRPSAAICFGQSFLDALISKYVEAAPTSGEKETVILGSSKGAIEVEAVGMNKVRQKFAKLERLREISLDTEDVAYADPPGAIQRTCPNVRSLDLSDSLLPSWEIVALIAAELPKLETLSLNRNRFAPLIQTNGISSAFVSLTELRLNHTSISWPDIVALMPAMPKLCYLEHGYNGLRKLGCNDEHAPTSPMPRASLEALNFDGNSLEEWSDIMMAITPFKTLTRLVLSSNHLTSISSLVERPIHHLRHIGLQDNLLSNWTDIDALAMWLPGLETLNITGNPLVTGSKDFRQLALARLPSLAVMNGTSISPKERSDSEIFYLSHIAQSKFSSEDDKEKQHPRWKELCAKYGAPEEARNIPKRDTLASRLISVFVYRCSSPPMLGQEGETNPKASVDLNCLSQPLELRVLPTMALKVFRLRVMKLLGIPPNKANEHRIFLAWILMGSNILFPFEFEPEKHELSWCGLEEGSRIIVYTNTTNLTT